MTTTGVQCLKGQSNTMSRSHTTAKELNGPLLPQRHEENFLSLLEVEKWSVTLANVMLYNSKVEKFPVNEVTFFPSENILRKVLLYDFGNGLLTVVDYLCPWNQALYVPIVPVYPEKGDMLLVQGAGPSDVWYSHVRDIVFRNKSVDVYFFIESRRCPNVFVRESS